ncbi:TadE/TadG family type IV pilus assembly protein [Allorhodopirellula solitaria]|uniref:Putative Flp pilus-assembly TadG-like N-terminal domain-containing protein n=1 Tax=Allorhodopirellula solitaria TaxID=2527987 RepID=A0A5C5YC81_9BACT|nr:Tad domain-containing protein [Allorhodopirellula solitaria]TWT73327.1 hypothetical protein CA85_17960 [Allorhodopirellula solitaria]
MNRRRTNPPRGGYVMVLFAMMLFGLMAMAALVIDLGFARLAQRQMQTAADAAALEGLRYASTDGRQRAADVVAWTLEGDFDPSSESSGPNRLASNPGDDKRGDMLDGLYAFDPPASSTAQDSRQFHREANDYTRSDFPNPNPSDDSSMETHEAFLVRVRRTDEVFDDGVGTAGPALPFLFGHGSMLNRESVGDGIAVRATSIAALQPVVCVGSSDETNDVPGKLDVAVPLSEWEVGSGETFREYAEHAIGGEATDNAAPEAGTGYVAIYDEEINDRVIGFGAASISDGVFTEVEPFGISNASATFCYSYAGTPDDTDMVFKSRQDNREVLCQLPVSAR